MACSLPSFKQHPKSRFRIQINPGTQDTSSKQTCPQDAGVHAQFVPLWSLSLPRVASSLGFYGFKGV